MPRPLSGVLMSLSQPVAFRWRPSVSLIRKRERWFVFVCSAFGSFNSHLQATSRVYRVCETPSLLPRLSAPAPPSNLLHINDRASLPVATSTNQDAVHRVGPIVAACLSAAGGVLLIGLVLFWFLLRHRLRMAKIKAPDPVPRSWVTDSQGGPDIHIVANHPSMSVDLTGAETENVSAPAIPVSAQSAEAIQLNMSPSVLDISVDNALAAPLPSSPTPSFRRSSLPGPLEPYVPSQVPSRTPTLRIHTNVSATSTNRGSRLSSPTPAQSSRSPVRPLPTPPTTPCASQSVCAKADEADDQFRHSQLTRSVASPEVIRSHSQGTRRSRAHSVASAYVEMDGYDVVQHHDGGAHARIDLPPPYHECSQAQASKFASLSHQSSVRS